jgi:putative transposase
MTIVKTYHFKLKPTPVQEHIFAQWLGPCRFVYNLYLEYRQLMHRQWQKSVSKNELQKQVKDLVSEVEWLKPLHSQTLQDVTDPLEKTYKGFFNLGAGFSLFRQSLRIFLLQIREKLALNPFVVWLNGKSALIGGTSIFPFMYRFVALSQCRERF